MWFNPFLSRHHGIHCRNGAVDENVRPSDPVLSLFSFFELWSLECGPIKHTVLGICHSTRVVDEKVRPSDFILVQSSFFKLWSLEYCPTKRTVLDIHRYGFKSINHGLQVSGAQELVTFSVKLNNHISDCEPWYTEALLVIRIHRNY